MSGALRSERDTFAYVGVEVFAQMEMCYNLISATVPSLTMFLASARTGLLDLGGTTTATGTYGSASRQRGTQQATAGSQLSKRRAVASVQEQGSEAIELTDQGHGATCSAVAVDKREPSQRPQQERGNSLSSDDSQRAIIRVERTVSLRYGN